MKKYANCGKKYRDTEDNYRLVVCNDDILSGEEAFRNKLDMIDINTYGRCNNCNNTYKVNIT